MKLHFRSDLHLARKLWHLCMGVFMATWYWSGLSKPIALGLLLIALVFNLAVETARLQLPTLNERILRFMGPLMRSCEINRYSGTPYYLAATLLSVAIFPRTIAVLSVLFLAVGDPIASLVGILYGKHSIQILPGKSLIGTLAGILACMVVGFIFFTVEGIAPQWIVLLSLIGGIAGGTAELLPLEVDDNFAIPVVSGFVLWLAFIFLGL